MNLSDVNFSPILAAAPLTPQEVAAANAEMAGGKPDKNSKTPIFPVPADAPPCNFEMPAFGGKPTMLTPYHTAEGLLLGYIARFEFVDPETGETQKKILPVCYCELANGQRKWRSVGMPKPRPPYNLPEILAHLDAPILVCEGEKTAEAGKQLFPDFVSTTPMHGAQSPHHTDWSSVAGRRVIITTDYDEAGAAFGDAVFDLCMAAGAASVMHLPAEVLGQYVLEEGRPARRAEPVPQGYDIADLLPEGWMARDIARLDQSQLLRPYIKQAEMDALQRAIGSDFRLTPHGVEYAKEVDGSTEWKWFCSYLVAKCQTRDTQGQNWGRVLELIDNDGKRKEYVMPMTQLAGDGIVLREGLLSRGLKLAPRANGMLHSYITMANPKARALCVSKPGWHQGNFVLSNRVYGAASKERIVLQQDVPQAALKMQGSLTEWQQEIGALCAGNSRLMLAISTALCGPLLYLLGEENFGVHFSGGSSVGKTTALIVASSFYGCPMGSWRTTDNAAESLARQANDTLLVMDELSQADAHAADAMAYMLGNGTPKARSRRDGSARPVETFKLVFISSGETGLGAKMLEGGRAAKAGQTVRFIEIPADAGVGFGLFDCIHHLPDSNRLAIALKANAQLYTGTAADAYLKALTADPAIVAERVIAARKAWAAQHIPADSDGQVMRVGQKFALIAAAGELGIALGLLPWVPESASRACERIFRDWMAARGGTVAYELTEAERRLRLLIAQHGSSRFEAAWGCSRGDEISFAHDARVLNRAGFKRINSREEWEYYILPAVFEKEVIAGLPEKLVKAHLADKCLLTRDNGGKFSMSVKVPGHQAMRLYHVPAGVLDGEDYHGNS